MDVLMPQLGETVAEGKIVRWFKSVGDKVSAGENICEIETDKVTVEVPAISGGTISAINISEGTVAPVGAVIAVVSDEATQAAIPVPAATQSSRPAAVANASPPVPTAAEGASHSRLRPREYDLFREVNTPPRNFGPAKQRGIAATPLARRLAAEAGLDLGAVAGTGPRGRIIGKDVETATRMRSVPHPSLTRAEYFDEMIGDIHRARPHVVTPISTMRQTVATRLVESKVTIPHFYLAAHVAVDRLMAIREEINSSAPIHADGSPAYRLTVNDLMIKALGLALEATPRANAIWSRSGILAFEHADVAVAVAVPDGLLTPVIHAVETKPVAAISREMKSLAVRARQGALRPEEYKGGTTTLSNLGMHGITDFAAIINPPQATILAIGAAERIAVETAAGGIAFAGRITATLSCDHRVVDGVLGAELLAAFKVNVEEPTRLLV